MEELWSFAERACFNRDVRARPQPMGGRPPARRPLDPLAVLEACYAPQETDAAWLEGVLAAWQPLIDDGLGVAAYFVDSSRPTPEIRGVITRGSGLSADEILAPIRSRSDAMSAQFFRPPRPCSTASVASGLGAKLIEAPFWRSWFERLGMRDSLGIVALDAEYKGCVISAGRRNLARVGREEATLYPRLAAHVTAGLRARSNGGAPHPDASEAVLRGDGKLLHASGSASSRASRSALAEGARRIDRARGRLRREDSAGAVAIWEGLVAGRWSLLDHFDHDGRRFVVAKANAPTAPRGTAPLSTREWQVARSATLGHSNKLIAYELGLSESTVSTHLRHAKTKLGVGSRVELVALLRGAVDVPRGATR